MVKEKSKVISNMAIPTPLLMLDKLVSIWNVVKAKLADVITIRLIT